MARELLPSPREDTRLERATIVAQVLISVVLCAPFLMHLRVALPGQPGLADLPGTVNYHWLIERFGLFDATESRMLMFPSQVNRLVIDGFPLDALITAPLSKVLGWPAGFSVAVWLSFLCLGLAHAWLGKVWWGSERAALVGGVLAQLSPYLVREVVDGRPTQLFGAIFLPLAIGLCLRAVHSRPARLGLLSGGMVGLSALSYWYYGVFCALSLAVVLLMAQGSGLRVGRTVLWVGAGAAAVAGLPVLYTLQSVGDMPGIRTAWSDPVLHGSEWVALVQILEFRDLGASVVEDRVLAAQALVAAGLVACLRLESIRHTIAPLFMGLTALLLAAGPTISMFGILDVPGPFHIFRMSDALSRLWWPDRALVMLVPAVSLLGAGGFCALLGRYAPPGRQRVALLGLTLALVLEAFLVIPGLPIPVAWGGETAVSRALAAGEGPVLILPIGHGESEPDMQMLIDQVHHGRPLVNGPMVPGSSAAPQAFRDFAESAPIEAMLACEAGRVLPVQPSEWARLRDAGIIEIVLDPARARALPGDGARYESCIQALLGPPAAADPTLQHYAIP